jgi:hypothetical protein
MRKDPSSGHTWWYMTVIPAAQETEAGDRSSKPFGAKVSKTLSQK